MNKLTKLLITISILLSTLGSQPVFLDVYAANVPSTNLITACGPNKYSVDKIIGYDNFQNVACYSETEFSLAYNKMLEIAPNSVIRHDSSDSPLNIVAADRAVAYSMNFTYLEQDTLNLYSDKDLSTYYTYINQSNTLYYYDTYIIGNATTVKPENLSVLIEINGAKGYVRLKGVDIIPMIYVENRVDLTKDDLYNNTLNVGNSWYVAYQTRNSDGSFKSDAIRPNISYYIVAPLNNKLIPKSPSCSFSNGDLVLYTDTATGSFCLSVGKAPSWLTAGKYYSKNGIDFYYDIDLTNPVLNNGVEGKHYNYFSYLPLRSKTNYTAIELNNYLKSTLSSAYQQTSVILGNEQFFIDSQNTYGMNALLILAMGIQESLYGTSTYAQKPANLNGTIVYNSETGILIPNTTVSQFCTQNPNGNYKDENGVVRYCKGRNNIFGYAAYDSDPNNAAAFISLESGINDQVGRNLRYYLDAMNSNHYSSSLGNKGIGINTRYASDPWWSVKIASIAYQIDKYLGFKDYDNYQLGILKNEENRDFYSDYSLGTKIYSINSKASTYTVLIHEQNGEKYRIQSTNPYENSNTIIVSYAGNHMKPVNWTPTLQYKYSNLTEQYKWDTSFEYKDTSSINLINTSKNPIANTKTTDDLLYGIEKFEWVNGNTLYIKGMGILDNTAMPNVSDTSHSIILKNTSNNTEYEFKMNTIEGSFNNYNNLTYNSVRYDGNLDISTIPDGSYYLVLQTKYLNTVGTSRLSDPAYNPIIPEIKINENRLQKIVMDNLNYMQYQIILQSNIPSLDYSLNLPTEYMSVVQLYDYNISDSNILNLNGLGYINGVNMSETSRKQVTLVLISKNNSSNVYRYNLVSHNNGFDPSIDDFDYSYSWFKSDNIDLSIIPDDEYKLFIHIETDSYSDFAEIRDFSFKDDLIITKNNRTLQFKLNIARRQYDLIIRSN